jgi:superfamily II DNA or RNA helicase
MSTGSGKTIALLSRVVHEAYLRQLKKEKCFIALCFVPLLALQAAHFSSLSSSHSGAIDAISLHKDGADTTVNALFKQFRMTQLSKSVLLLLSPEHYVAVASSLLDNAQAVEFLLFDELHCYLEWRELRSAFSELKDLSRVFGNARILAVSATATTDQQKAFSVLLGVEKPWNVIEFFKPREGVRYHFLNESHVNRHVRGIFSQQNLCDMLVIVSSLTNLVVLHSKIMAWTGLTGDKVRAYAAGMSAAHRNATQSWFSEKADRFSPRILVATVAFGVGIDLKSIKCVVIWGILPSLNSMIQAMGRVSSGRGGNQEAGTVYQIIDARGYQQSTDARLKEFLGSPQKKPASIDGSVQSACCEACFTWRPLPAEKVLDGEESFQCRDVLLPCVTQPRMPRCMNSMLRAAALQQPILGEEQPDWCGSCDFCIPPLSPIIPEIGSGVEVISATSKYFKRRGNVVAINDVAFLDVSFGGGCVAKISVHLVSVLAAPVAVPPDPPTPQHLGNPKALHLSLVKFFQDFETSIPLQLLYDERDLSLLDTHRPVTVVALQMIRGLTVHGDCMDGVVGVIASHQKTNASNVKKAKKAKGGGGGRSKRSHTHGDDGDNDDDDDDDDDDDVVTFLSNTKLRAQFRQFMY